MASVAAAPAGEAPAGGQSYGAPGYRAYVLLSLTLVYTLNFIDRNLLGVVAQPIIQTFGLSDTEYGFLNGPPFALFYALMGIPIAIAADRYNRVFIMALCIAIWSLMTALCGFATSFVFLLIARVGVAIGEAGGTPPSNSIIADYFKPKSRANALGIFAMGVTLGGALANAFGGPIGGMTDATVVNILNSVGLGSMPEQLGWGETYGWRFAFIALGLPGVLVALILVLTVKEPPRGFTDPPGVQRVQKASIVETLKELGSKPTFWTMAIGASLVALVGYGLFGFQAPMMQRVNGISPGQFALQYGVPLSLLSAVGTFTGGFLAEKLTPRFPSAVTWLPAVGLLLAVPLYIWAFYLPVEQKALQLTVWGLASACHYSYLGAQYTIGQGVVSQRSRASAIAVLLFLIALIGNGLGPQIVGILSDMFMHMQIEAQGMADVLTNEVCRQRDLSALTPEQQSVCTLAYGEGLRQSMAATILFFIPAAAFFLIASLTYKKDVVARPVH
ncbi:MAG: MFS transporter [Alphaproteobacteria bacterium]|nr:MFS transporter [Alphaproteobacteria bacterium]